MNKPQKDIVIGHLSSGNYPIAGLMNPESINTSPLTWTTTTGTTTATLYYSAADAITQIN